MSQLVPGLKLIDRDWSLRSESHDFSPLCRGWGFRGVRGPGDIRDFLPAELGQDVEPEHLLVLADAARLQVRLSIFG